MLTKEQLYNLKRGDEIIVHGTYDTAFDDGDICVDSYWTVNGERRAQSFMVHSSYVSLPSEHGTSVPTPKYDPTRPFRTGDIVKRRTVDGRTDPDVPEDTYLTVTTDETKHGNVRVQEPNGRSIVTKAVFLELISPAEEQMPYYVETETFDYEIRNANDDPDIGTRWAFHIKFQDPDEREILSVKSYFASYVYSCEHAEADAKAECKRLNDEWRKNQNHD